MTTSIRAAGDADVDHVASVWEVGWRDAHLGRVPDALVRARTSATFLSRAKANLPSTLVAIVDATVAGFVVVVEDEIEQIFVSAEHRGSGVARELLAAAEHTIAVSGYPSAWLAVVADNERARRFYSSNGWTDEGDFIYQATVEGGQVDVPCRRYTKALPDLRSVNLTTEVPIIEEDRLATSIAGSSGTDNATVPDPRRWRVLAFLGIAQLMLIVDVTVVALALPEMGADLGLDRAALTWVASIYALVFGGLMLLGGKAADLVGPRNVVLTGLTIFTLASLLAGFATSPEMLLIGRAFQGVGAAAMSPAALSVIARSFTGDELTRALGVWSALGGAGAAVGVLVGGALTAGPGWAWVFWVNVPIGALLLLLLIRSVPRLSGAGGRLDVLGALLVTLATGSVVYALVSAGDHGWLGPPTLIGLLGGVVGYALFAFRQRATRSPLIQPGMLRRRPLTVGFGLIFIATALMISVFFLGSFTLQRLHGFDAMSAGLSFLPAAIGTILGANLAARFVGRLGLRVLSVLGLAIAGVGLAAAAGIFSMEVLVVGLGVAGFGLGAVFLAASASTFSAVEPEEAGVASGTLSTFHEFGAATGVSAVSSIAAVALVDPGFEAFASGYWFAAVVAATSAVLALVLVPSRPSALGLA